MKLDKRAVLRGCDLVPCVDREAHQKGVAEHCVHELDLEVILLNVPTS